MEETLEDSVRSLGTSYASLRHADTSFRNSMASYEGSDLQQAIDMALLNLQDAVREAEQLY